ncbi:MAG: hypothetical protein A3G47_01740 [Candidatus Zambryskibacteria bacterium RIFCSPLOWO2_12_FULL_39_45]|uniref:HTH deoR-type domain-containing protein n=2 Tax=Candidatus Zambryskiibacteriota TaxID=1817925 RepID=A0A1G2UU96_9BACT|nr:MAG: hypothetical protein UT81_C0007G0025 [Parcubacteria group bacterium GW2011_GWA2_40_14]OHA97833.1 MAG: hypothetical protein A3E32_02535 [Candidatus Zambryskibacteria bacterium RIFCSPHIGHO2_12_FULL_38_37]OHB07832.1 MAG: hypothetical protein A2W64_01885 [Candidatus Zambryskibacteria bacterium RIFCSPLOWO2_02_39_10]OHB10339.1 MAG: hypothetical protein A3I21_02750 [Candidatus Zambryskibacteria bacterium RIFCSPLOWO2_02_FULL_39_69]OHB12990.1 MAG: hypothetical protein A2Y49_02080 [Candidatus Zam
MDDKKQNQVDITGKNLEPISFFEKDGDFVFTYKKTEKLATALYMITNTFSPDEPMKWTLRKKVSDLLSFILNYKDLSTTKTLVLELTSFLEISSKAGMISPMNLSILKQEFSNLLSRIDFSTDIKTLFETENKPYFKPELQSISRRVSDDNKDKTVVHDKNILKKSNRQSIIIEILKKKKEVIIKDIVEIIRNCSEKTIQRELISLIENGVVRRTGQRRWSKYSLTF